MSKKTIISTMAGALAGGIIASCMTLGMVGYVEKTPSAALSGEAVSEVRGDYTLAPMETAGTKEVLSVEEIAAFVYIGS